MPARCMNLQCVNVVPDGWEGGYCDDCLSQIAEAEADAYDRLLDEAIADHDEAIGPVVDPYEQYGFDHVSELWP